MKLVKQFRLIQKPGHLYKTINENKYTIGDPIEITVVCDTITNECKLRASGNFVAVDISDKLTDLMGEPKYDD